MNASKENCRKAQEIVQRIKLCEDTYEFELDFLRDFLAKCEAKLPHEKSFEKKSKSKGDLV